MNKLVVILGPTSSGKSSLAIKLAQKFNGEIISADSRQVYKGMDIGTGKATRKEQKLITHHLLNVASPKKQFTVADFKSYATRAIAQITYKNKIPFLVGGTAFYIYSLIDDWQIPKVKPNLKLRKQLEKKSVKELFRMLKKLDPKRAKTIETKNKRRLIRALEIIKTTGKIVPQFTPPPLGEGARRAGEEGPLLLGLNPPGLKKLISKRVEQRFRQGLIPEIKKLLRSGVSLKRLNQIGLTYGLVAEAITQNARPVRRSLGAGGSSEISYRQLINKVITAEQQLARRQMTWFKRDHRIHWVTGQNQAEKLIRKFLKE